jgi:hypothetical protein
MNGMVSGQYGCMAAFPPLSQYVAGKEALGRGRYLKIRRNNTGLGRFRPPYH